MRDRHQLITLLIPAILALYIVMLPLNRVIEQEHVEIFPFFHWSLFSVIPDWQTTEYGLMVHSIDGAEVDGNRYLIPNDEVRDWKALLYTAKECKRDGFCDERVEAILFPLVLQRTGAEVVEFSIIEASVDLRDIQEGIRDLAADRTSTTDFFQPRTEIGRWNTQVGRVR